jgi:hypothetical protein
MKRAALLLSLLVIQPVSAQNVVPIAVKGDGVKVIQVDKVVTVKVDQTVVASFPFTLYAPPGAALYFWAVPTGVEYTDQGDTLLVTSAPKGLLTISVKVVSVDWTKQVFTTKFGKVCLVIGDPGPIPVPPVPPSLLQALQAAYLADNSPQAKAKALALAMQAASAFVPTATNVQGVATALQNAMAAQGFKKGDAPNLEKAVGAWLNTHIPTNAMQVLSAADKATIVQAFTDIANGLQQVSGFTKGAGK